MKYISQRSMFLNLIRRAQKSPPWLFLPRDTILAKNFLYGRQLRFSNTFHHPISGVVGIAQHGIIPQTTAKPLQKIIILSI